MGYFNKDSRFMCDLCVTHLSNYNFTQEHTQNTTNLWNTILTNFNYSVLWCLTVLLEIAMDVIYFTINMRKHQLQ